MSKQNFNQPKKTDLGINDIRIWKQKSNLLGGNILETIYKSQKIITNNAETLNEGERHTNKKKHTFLSFDKYKTKKENQSYASDIVKKIMGDVGKLILNIKKEEDNLSKTNVNSLLETKNQIKTSDVIQEQNKILKIKEKEYKLNLEGKTKKPPNYRFLSDGYRKQVNKAFMDYNPLSHLVHIRRLRKTSQELDKKFRMQMDEIDKGIRTFKTFKGFNIDKSNKRKTNYKIHRKSNLKELGQTLPTAASNTITDGYNTVKGRLSSKTLFGKKFRKNKDFRRKFPDKENREIELNLLKDCCEQIGTSISPKTVNNYFKDSDKLKNLDLDSQKHTYFKNIDSAQKILREIQENLFIKKMEEDILNKKKYTLIENDKLVDKIKILKSSILNEIDEQEKKQGKNLMV